MKEKFQYKEGKIYYYDDKEDKYEEKEYQDNIEEILSIENIMESLEQENLDLQTKKDSLQKEIWNLKNKLAYYTQTKRKHILQLVKKYILLNLGGFGLSFLAHFLFLLSFKEALLFFFIFFIVTNGFATYSFYFDFKNTNALPKKANLELNLEEKQNELNGIFQKELSLKEMLKNYQTGYENLNQEKKKQKENTMTEEVKVLPYRKSLEKRKIYLELLYQCVYHRKKLMELYLNNRLIETIESYCTKEQLHFVCAYTQREVMKLERKL